MAWTVDYAFADFHTRINLAGDHRTTANIRKDWIVGRLRTSFTILEAFAFGSIPKYTALADHADLDVLVALHYGNHIEGRKPSTVLANVKAALGSSAGSIRRNGQAVTVRFQSWPSVDVVPASRVVDHNGSVIGYSIPDMTRETWLSSKPRAHSKRLTDAATARGPKFRQIIKMVKDWSRRQPVQLESFHIEAMALRAQLDWSDYSWAVFKLFEAMSGHLFFMWYDDTDVSAYLDYARRKRAEEQLAVAAAHARSAWYLTYGANDDHRAAIGYWRQIFGQRFPTYG